MKTVKQRTLYLTLSRLTRVISVNLPSSVYCRVLNYHGSTTQTVNCLSDVTSLAQLNIHSMQFPGLAIAATWLVELTLGFDKPPLLFWDCHGEFFCSFWWFPRVNFTSGRSVTLKKTYTTGESLFTHGKKVSCNHDLYLAQLSIHSMQFPVLSWQSNLILFSRFILGTQMES